MMPSMKTNIIKHEPATKPNSIKAISGYYRYGFRKCEMNPHDIEALGTTPLHMRLPAIVDHIERIVTKHCGGFTCKVGYMQIANGLTKFGGPNCEWEVTFEGELSTPAIYEINDFSHEFNTDDEAFKYAHDAADSYIPVYKMVRKGDLFRWEITERNGNFWSNAAEFIYVP
jgi:hypothetical protein